jgi:hypothetical protein
MTAWAAVQTLHGWRLLEQPAQGMFTSPGAYDQHFHGFT